MPTEPYYADDWLTVYAGDCRAVLATLPDESVNCVVTSPPYWGLRDYGTATWIGGDEGCDHLGPSAKPSPKSTLGIYADGRSRYKDGWDSDKQTKADFEGTPYRDTCGKCGATRQDSQLGLEPTPEQYVENMVAVFREVRRVLRNDGTLWLNLGDTYASQPAGNKTPNQFMAQVHQSARDNENDPKRATSNWRPPAGLKPKDLVGIPWRVAFALQADGWYLRSDIIWSKPNPMPESVTDRPTKSHEYVFLLAKSQRYYFDHIAVREAPSANSHGSENGANVGTKAALTGNHSGSLGVTPAQRWPGIGPKHGTSDNHKSDYEPMTVNDGRNIRSVWTIPTQPYPGAHFAVFPPKLIEPCIKAGTSERGVCPECGAPWRRITERETVLTRPGKASKLGTTEAERRAQGRDTTVGLQFRPETTVTTMGWQPSCAHTAEPVPATVLDVFAGSGTTGMVAQSLSRRAILIDLNPDYIEQQLRRNQDVPLGLSA